MSEAGAFSRASGRSGLCLDLIYQFIGGGTVLKLGKGDKLSNSFHSSDCLDS